MIGRQFSFISISSVFVLDIDLVDATQFENLFPVSSPQMMIRRTFLLDASWRVIMNGPFQEWSAHAECRMPNHLPTEDERSFFRVKKPRNFTSIQTERPPTHGS